MFNRQTLGKVEFLEDPAAWSVKYEVPVELRLVVNHEGIAGHYALVDIAGIQCGSRRFRIGQAAIRGTELTDVCFSLPHSSGVEEILTDDAIVALGDLIADLLRESTMIGGEEIPVAYDVPFAQAVSTSPWAYAPEDDEVEHDLYDLPSSRDDAPVKGTTFRNGEAVEAETTEQEKDKDFWF